MGPQYPRGRRPEKVGPGRFRVLAAVGPGSAARVYAGIAMTVKQSSTQPGLEVLHLSTIIKRPLVDGAGDRLGRVQDLIVRLGDSPYPPVVGLVVRIGERDLFVPIRKVAAFE